MDLTSFDLYTKYPLGGVLKADTLIDNCCGMNPCYYIEGEYGLKVSTSVMSLIVDSQSFELNPDFRPPKFFLHPWQRNTVVFSRAILDLIEKKLHNTSFLKSKALAKVKSMVSPEIKTILWSPHQPSYISNKTIDSRIRKIRAFESVGTLANSFNPALDGSIKDLDVYIDKSVHYLCKSINDIEKQYPDKQHIILMGGKDSQLISLIPKLNDENWHVFSAEPNYPLIRDWLSTNDIKVNKLFFHDGGNEETIDEFKNKIICGDLYTSPIHIRYAPALKKIAKEFNNECIFWLGSMPRRSSLYDGVHAQNGHSKKRKEFFNSHFNSFPAWQGNIQQTYSNYIGCPFLCPYYLNDIWSELYVHIDPGMIEKGIDLRPRLGEALAGREIVWPEGNPGPTPYKYWWFWFNSAKYYKKYASNHVK